MQNINCNDDSSLNKGDKFSKHRLLFEILNKIFMHFAPCEEIVHSVGEAMVPYFGRHGAKHFIRREPIRWCYKLWTGAKRLVYIEWCDPYQGSSTT